MTENRFRSLEDFDSKIKIEITPGKDVTLYDPAIERAWEAVEKQWEDEVVADGIRRWQLFNGSVSEAEAAMGSEDEDLCRDAIYFLEHHSERPRERFTDTWKQMAATDRRQNVRTALFEALGGVNNKTGNLALGRFLAEFVSNDKETSAIRGVAYFALLMVLEDVSFPMASKNGTKISIMPPSPNDAVSIIVKDKTVEEGVRWDIVKALLYE